MESIVGKILSDQYRITQELKVNPLSVVYLAEDVKQDTPTICEVEQLSRDYFKVDGSLQSWQQAQKAFLHQGYILKDLSLHPQIPNLYDFFVCEGEFYLIREHIAGQHLDQRLSNSLLSEAEALEWLQEIAMIIEFTHERGGAHLNIQPSSLLQAQDGRKLLTGFSHHSQELSPQSINHPAQQHSPNNSLRYSPQVRDIQALGKTMIYALTGSLGNGIQAKSLSIVNAPESSSQEQILVADVSPKLAMILNKMIEEYPENCYGSVTEVLTELDFEKDVVVLPPPFIKGNIGIYADKSTRVSSKASSSNTLSSSWLIPEVIWLLLSLPFIIALLIVTIGVKRNAYKDFDSYQNQEYEFKVRYPEKWSQRKLDDPITGDIVVFASPLETSTDLFQEKLQIAVEYLPSDIKDLEQYAQIVLERIQQGQDGEVDFYEEFSSTIDKSPAKTIIYSRQEGNLDLRQMETFTIRNDQAYIAIYTAERAKFSKFYGTVEKIIHSWTIE